MPTSFFNQGMVKYTLYVVCCKRCGRNILAGCDAFPRDNIVVVCQLCGEKRRYMPSQVYLGTPHTPDLERKPSQGVSAPRKRWRA